MQFEIESDRFMVNKKPPCVEAIQHLGKWYVTLNEVSDIIEFTDKYGYITISNIFEPSILIADNPEHRL